MPDITKFILSARARRASEKYERAADQLDQFEKHRQGYDQAADKLYRELQENPARSEELDRLRLQGSPTAATALESAQAMRDWHDDKLKQIHDGRSKVDRLDEKSEAARAALDKHLDKIANRDEQRESRSARREALRQHTEAPDDRTVAPQDLNRARGLER